MNDFEKKNIWIFNHYATDMYKNHGGRHYWFAKYLNNNGYDVKIFCANTFHNKVETIEIKGKNKWRIAKSDNIHFVFVKTISSVGNGFKRILNMFYFYINIFKAAKDNYKISKPDVIIASSVHPLTMIAGIKIAKKMKIPCICEVRDLWPEAIFSFGKVKENSIIGKLLIKGEHWIYKKADKVIFTKPGDTDYLKEHKWDIDQGGDIDINKCYYINNGVDLEEFNKSISTNIYSDVDLVGEKFNVIYTGAIRPVNNIDNILECAKFLLDESDIQFLIYGEGNQLEFLKNKAKNENITNVKFKGYVNKKYIPYILSKASVNILNYSQSLYNWSRGNSSNKLFEYMASGKPIISTVKMGYDIIEKYNCGTSLEKNTPEELSKKILEMKVTNFTNYNIYCENSLNGVKDFDFKYLTDKLIDLIEN